MLNLEAGPNNPDARAAVPSADDIRAEDPRINARIMTREIMRGVVREAIVAMCVALIQGKPAPIKRLMYVVSASEELGLPVHCLV